MTKQFIQCYGFLYYFLRTYASKVQTKIDAIFIFHLSSSDFNYLIHLNYFNEDDNIGKGVKGITQNTTA